MTSDSVDEIKPIYNNYLNDIFSHTNRMFSFLLIVEWILAIIFTFIGPSITIHSLSPYIVILGGAFLALCPFFLIRKSAVEQINRYFVAFSQISFSFLFIYLADGKFEAYFFLFFSIVFLSFYADWRLLVIATILAALEYFVQGKNVPVEYLEGYLFLASVLIYNIKIRKKNLWSIAKRELSLQRAMESTEHKSQKRTWELQESINVILEQQQSLVASAKMSTLGEMSAGIAHEINNPLTIIIGKTSRLKKRLEAGGVDREELIVVLTQIVETSNRIVKIIKGLRTFSRDGENDPMEIIPVSQVIQDTLELCQERFRDNSIELKVDLGLNLDTKIEGRAVQLSQVLFNLLNNAIDAISTLPEKWVEITVSANDSICSISVTDSGHGIESLVQDKLMLPFFTTKEVGKGTGLGLSISKVIIERHNGRLFYNSSSPHTQFVIELPLISKEKEI